MASKSNIRSIRISDDMLELIEQQAGNNFTEKWENLVTRCVWELPQKERQLEILNQQILEKRKQLGRMSNRVDGYARMLQSLEYDLHKLSNTIAKAQEHEV